MNNKIQGGSLANKSGKTFEQILIPIFKSYDYVFINEKSENGKLIFTKKEQEELKQTKNKYFIKDAPYITIYGHKGKTEFVLVNKCLGKEIRIECKWQQSAGSVDEKYPYLYLNCVDAFEEQEIILIIDGGGMKLGAEQWLKDKINQNWLNYKNKKISIMKIQEFITWFNNIHKN